MGVQCSIAMQRVKGTSATDLPCFSNPKPQHLRWQPYPMCSQSTTAIWGMLLRKQTNTRTCMSSGLVLILPCFEGKICRMLWFLPPLSTLCWSSLRCIFLGPVHVLPMARWRMSERGRTSKRWVLNHPGEVMVRNSRSHCLLVQHFLLSSFPLQHLPSQSFLQTVESLIWGLIRCEFTVFTTPIRRCSRFLLQHCCPQHTLRLGSVVRVLHLLTTCSKPLPCSWD